VNPSDEGVSVENGQEGAASPRPVRWRRLALALLLVLLVALAVVWLQRRTIARSFVDRELARRGVLARYEIEQLSPWRQRLTNVSIGDPRDPDLVADWIELRTALSPWRAEVLVVKAGTIRAKGRIVNGALSLGSLDALMPPPSGKPFSLPRLIVDVADARFLLDSEAGRVALHLSGKGMLTDGFAGTLRADAPQLRIAGCALDGMAARMQVRIRDGAPRLEGPAEAARLTCADTRLARPSIDIRASLDAALARWSGNAGLGAATIESPFGSVQKLSGTLNFAGSAARTEGAIALRADRLAAREIGAGSAALSGRYAFGDAATFKGEVRLENAALSPAVQARVAGYGDMGNGTPVAPLVAQLAQALREAGRGFRGTAAVAVEQRGDRTALRLSNLDVSARSGARLYFGQGPGLGLALPGTAIDLAGMLSLSGGGLPDARIRLSRRAGSEELRGTGFVRPYAAGGARLALAGLDFRLRGAAGDVRTSATLSGPLGGGRVEGLSMPLVARWDARAVALNPQCSALRFARVAAAGAVLDGGHLQLCPLGPAMLQWSAHGLAGGIRVAKTELHGKVGESPLLLAAEAAQLDLAARRFGLAGAVARIGTAEQPTHFEVGQLDGSFRSGLGGEFAGLGGRIGAVPLVLSAGNGSWSMEGNDLLLRGGFALADAEASARFVPLAASQASLRLHDGRIEAQAELANPARQVPVGTVKVTHDLNKGEGDALLDVPGIHFRTDGLQPSDLTSLTYGVIADVDGLVSGSGRFRWSGDSVTSSGSLVARDVDLAAAFGPVQGLNTRIDFTDLLNLRSAAGQAATIREINPGVPVREGALRYQLLDSRRVQVEGARWPFAGGELILDPTILDFNEKGERRLVFHVKGADAALFLKEMAFDNLDATGTFDGTLPMIFDESGGRIEGGELRARAGGHIAYVGEVSRQNLGLWGNMAFQALKSLNYRSLIIRLNGPLAGEMITDISFSGVSQGKGTRSNFLIRRLAKLPFVFNVRINAPFRQLLDSVQSWYDPSRLIERNLPALLEEQKRAEEAAKSTVQPRESAPVP